ncbi:MAG: hypothetical protein HY010_06185 [Acidobacteria bacterium]|nr:hypothetical protein [Acidobacteriota bacterium]
MSRKSMVVYLSALAVVLFSALANAQSAGDAKIKVLRFAGPSAAGILFQGQPSLVHVGERLGEWTLMEIASDAKGVPASAILEDFTSQTGHLLVVDLRGVRLDLPKSLESTSEDPAKLYLGHTLAEIMNSASDLLGDQILAKRGDPDYEEIAGIFAPIRKMQTYSFVGTPESIDKIGFQYGGRTPEFDPAPYYPPINEIRRQGKVWDGLVGGYLPVVRFVYPESPGNWTEMISFAPLRISNGNNRIQPAWYRIVHVEDGAMKWVHYIDSYHPFPPRTEYDAKVFYRDLVDLHDGWQRMLAPGMKIDVPDERVGNMARFALVRDMMTRVADFPKYGVVDKDYAGSEHDGFPDTFNVDTAAMLEWGLIDRAGRYIDNYFGEFVRDDGSILYRGPETGQYGRMLTVLAQFANYGGDPALLIKRRSRIDGVTKLLLGLREKAKQLPKSDPAYGMIAGWSEADACLDADPPRYMQPYFSNSTEAARGFRDLGQVWVKIGQQTKNEELSAWGKRLVAESKELQADIQNAITKSYLKVDGETILPSIAGVKEPFHVVVPRDNSDPQFRSYRAYMEMLHSGILSKDEVASIVQYRSKHHDVILGVPTAYGYKTGAMAGFLSYGYAYGLIQHDMTREALLLMYSVMAHQFTRGTWTAPETRPVFDESPAAPYCTPAQLAVAMMTRWILVFEDPMAETLWLGKAIPRQWFEDGKKISVSGAPTRWGKIGLSMESHLKQGEIVATIDLPKNQFGATTKLRLRTPGQRQLKSVTLNGKTWTEFDPAQESITIPAGSTGVVKIVARY